MAAAPRIMNATSAAENNPAVKGYARATGKTDAVETTDAGAGAADNAAVVMAGAATDGAAVKE